MLLSSVWASHSHCGGFSCFGPQALGHMGFNMGFSSWDSWAQYRRSEAPEHRLSRRGAQALLLWSIRDLPGSGIKPMSSALEGGFFTTESLREPEKRIFKRALFPGGSDDKASACIAEDPGSIPGSGKSPGEGNGNRLQYSCLENSMNGGTWRATVHGVAKSRTRLSDFT